MIFDSLPPMPGIRPIRGRTTTVDRLIRVFQGTPIEQVYFHSRVTSGRIAYAKNQYRADLEEVARKVVDRELKKRERKLVKK